MMPPLDMPSFFLLVVVFLLRFFSRRLPLLLLLLQRQPVSQRLEVDGHLPQVASRPGLHERHARGEREAVDVAPRRDVVEAVEDQVEAFEKRDAVLGGADVAAVRGDLGLGDDDGRRRRRGAFNICPVVVAVFVVVAAAVDSDLDVFGGQGLRRGGGHARLGLPDVPGAEQELAVEVGDVDGVEVDLDEVEKNVFFKRSRG